MEIWRWKNHPIWHNSSKILPSISQFLKILSLNYLLFLAFWEAKDSIQPPFSVPFRLFPPCHLKTTFLHFSLPKKTLVTGKRLSSKRSIYGALQGRRESFSWWWDGKWEEDQVFCCIWFPPNFPHGLIQCQGTNRRKVSQFDVKMGYLQIAIDVLKLRFMLTYQLICQPSLKPSAFLPKSTDLSIPYNRLRVHEQGFPFW